MMKNLKFLLFFLAFALSCSKENNLSALDYDDVFIARCFDYIDSSLKKQDYYESSDSLRLAGLVNFLTTDEFSQNYISDLSRPISEIATVVASNSFGVVNHNKLKSAFITLRKDAQKKEACWKKSLKFAENNFHKFSIDDQIMIELSFSVSADRKFGQYNNCFSEKSRNNISTTAHGIIESKYFDTKIRKYYFSVRIFDLGGETINFMAEEIAEGETINLDLIEYGFSLTKSTKSRY